MKKRLFHSIIALSFYCITYHSLHAENNYLKKANDYFKQGKFSLAEIFYNKALQKQPEHFQANYNLGKIYFHQKQNKKAIKYLKRANDIKPDKTIVFMIANSHVNDNNPEKGLSVYSNLIKKYPAYADVYLNAGNIGYQYLYKKNITIANWERFLILRPNDPQSPNIRKALEYLRDPNFVLKPPAKKGDSIIQYQPVAGNQGSASSTNVIPLIPEIKGKDLKSKSEEKYNIKKKKTITTD